MSEDPYAISVDYIKYIFGAGPATPCPRFESHYMYQMTSRLEVPVTTLADGTCLLTISANAAV